MGLGVQPEDLVMDERVVFEQGEEVTFVCLDTFDNVSKESIMLKCKILSGEHTGKFHNIFLSKKRQHPHMIRKLRDFAKAFYTAEELKSGDQPLSRFYLRKFNATAEEPRPYMDKVYQDFRDWKDLGEDTDEAANLTPAFHANKTNIADQIPF